MSSILQLLTFGVKKMSNSKQSKPKNHKYQTSHFTLQEVNKHTQVGVED